MANSRLHISFLFSLLILRLLVLQYGVWTGGHGIRVEEVYARFVASHTQDLLSIGARWRKKGCRSGNDTQWD